MAAYLQSRNHNAKYVNPKDAGLFLTEEFGNAQVLPKSYELLKKLNDMEEIVVFPGFFGYSEDGDVVTFSRGGSDVTGGILAAALDADVYENFTDVDFVYAANPHIVDNPFPIPLFTYEEMRELSYGGFSVLHEEALAPVYSLGIPVNIRNTNNPDAPGTFIVADNKAPKSTFPVVGIAADKGFMTIHVYKYMMNREIGFGRRLLQILEEEGISYEHTPSGIDSISIIIREANCPEDKLERVVSRIYGTLGVNSVHVVHNQAIVMLVGRGMTKSVGIAARATEAFNRSGININMINQGSSEVSIMFGVDGNDAKPAVKALYDEFFN
jgi:aspartate kinase